MQVLKIILEAPSAHYRIPHSSNPHCTYPLPPYSTVIGILCNILGDSEQIANFLNEDFALGMLSSYQNITREYVWYRNLNAKMHNARYADISQRRWQERPDHPGGQSPITVEVLNQVNLIIYLHHRTDVIEQLMDNLERPERWFSHIHLGRSEDWAILVEKTNIQLEITREVKLTSRAGQYYQWLPGIECTWKPTANYQDYYQLTRGAESLISSTYRYINPLSGEPVDSSAGAIRNFNYIAAKLHCSPVPYTVPDFYVDADQCCPIFLARIKGGITGAVS